jgi:hypothetical protein
LNILTEQLSTVGSVKMPEALISDPVYSERTVSRMTLRQVLLTGMEDVVHFDHVFDRYEVGAALDVVRVCYLDMWICLRTLFIEL